MAATQDMGTTTGNGETQQAKTTQQWTMSDVAAKQFSWLRVAYGEIGTKEVPGSGDNPRVIEYHATTKLKATEDSVPWCSSFVNWCIEKSGYKGTDSAAARSWQSWGKDCGHFAPVGSIVVMKRKGGNHVGFFISSDNFNVEILGGNQSDTVNIRKFAHTQVLAYRLPSELNDSDDAVYEFLYRSEVA
jgi:uncharacterized protein (TIGR02594 family)